MSPKNVPDAELREQVWDRIVDAITDKHAVDATDKIFKQLDEQFQKRQIDMNFLKDGDAYVRSIALEKLGFTPEQLKAMEPRSMAETYQFIMKVNERIKQQAMEKQASSEKKVQIPSPPEPPTRQRNNSPQTTVGPAPRAHIANS